MINNSTTNNHYIKKQINDLQPGDIILHPLYRSDGLILIDKDRTLNEELIKIVQTLVSPTATVLIASSEENFHKFSKNNTSENKDFKNDMELLVQEFQSDTGQYFDYNSVNKDLAVSGSHYVKQLSICPYWILFENKFESPLIKKRCQLIKNEFLNLLNTNKVFDNYYNIIKAYDEILVLQSFNIVCTSLMIGLTLEMQDEDLIDLAIAALFLNIGFTSLPKVEFKNYLMKQGYNNPVMKRNIEIFSNVTTESPFLRKKSIIQGILDQHEYYNGFGFPNQKGGDEISLFGRILHIANSYDSLVCGYNDTTGKLPIDALHIIYENKEIRFDPNILQIFIQRTRYFKLEESIHLPNGEMGKIVGFDDYIKHPDRPIVELSNGSRFNLLTMSNL